MEYDTQIASDFVHIARLAMSGRQQDIQALLVRLARKYSKRGLSLSADIEELLRASPTRHSPIRREQAPPVPVDVDSKLHLLRIEAQPEVDVEPIFAADVQGALEQIIEERRHQSALASAGLSPTRTAIFTGPPGVGKTLAARWLAARLGLPLAILDLSAVMSSFLGRTGNNLRFVLDYAKKIDCVLLVDEIDAIAKRRDDAGDVGELKRLVTVILQELDDWPPAGLLVAATNHSELLDPAVWRRFEVRVDFPMPSNGQVLDAVKTFLGPLSGEQQIWLPVLAQAFQGTSFSDIERELLTLRRKTALGRSDFPEYAVGLLKKHMAGLDRKSRKAAAEWLTEYVPNLSQRQISEVTGVSRDTIRRAASQRKVHKGG